MSALRNAKQTILRVWGMGEEDEYEEEDLETTSRRARYEARPAPQPEPAPAETDIEDEHVETRTVSRTVYAPSSAARHGRSASEDEGNPPQSRFSQARENMQAQSGGGRGGNSGGNSGRGLRSVAMPLRAREKNIYTLKPKAMDEASLAADYLKTGCAVVVNLDEVERMIAVRIIDFMSGVCYGLEKQGHAMKLGDFIFLFTPGDFEITSDEVDYGENPDFIFKDMNQKSEAEAEAAATADEGAGGGDIAGERRSWER